MCSFFNNDKSIQGAEDTTTSACSSSAPSSSTKREVRLLSECVENQKVRIMTNCDLQSVELGLHAGAVLEVIKNEKMDQIIVVQLRGQQLMVCKQTAKHVKVL